MNLSPPILDLAFYAIAVPAVLITGISKGGLGGGLGILTVPLMSLVVPPLQAAAIMLPILCVMDLFGLWAYRGLWHRETMKIVLPAALAGILVAWGTAEFVTTGDIKLILGLVSVLFSLNYWLGGTADAAPAGQNRPKGWFWGFVSGFTSFVAHAGGPPLNFYLLPQKLDQRLFVGTTVVFFTIVNYAKLVPYALLGQFDGANLATAAVLSLLAPVGIAIGVWLVHRIDRQLFYRIAYALVFLIGSKLLWDGVAARFI